MQGKNNPKLNNYRFAIPSMLGYYLILGIITILYFFANGTKYTRDSYHQDGVSGVMNEIIGVPRAEEPEAGDHPEGSYVLEDGTVLSSDGYVLESPYLPEGWENPVAAEETTEEAAEAEAAPRQFYRLKTATKKQILHLREKPSLSAPILYRMPIGTPGYVLSKGEDWSFIVAETKDGIETGFAANRYMNMEEIPPEEVPEEYRAIPVPDYPEDPL